MKRDGGLQCTQGPARKVDNDHFGGLAKALPLAPPGGPAGVDVL